VNVALLPAGARSGYLKVRDRASYEFALTSAAAALRIEDGTILEARLGLAGVAYSWWQVRCEARATMRRDGTAVVRSAASDIGTGTYTVMRQLSAELLGLELAQVRVDLGDSDMPWSPAAGGSGRVSPPPWGPRSTPPARRSSSGSSTWSRTTATPRCGAAQSTTSRSPGDASTAGTTRARVSATRTSWLGSAWMSFRQTARARRRPPAGRRGAVGSLPGQVRRGTRRRRARPAPRGPHRVGGRRRADPQPEAGPQPDDRRHRRRHRPGAVRGDHRRPGTGRIANATLADYLVPVHADVPDMDVVFVGEPDPLTPIGTKGVGEIGLPGTAAAIANAVHHATGRRIRSLPITIDRLL
jgi:Molybdopterin-binding domain of aldehyde dehydrogenase